MNTLFEHIYFDNNLYSWAHRRWSDDDFPGYYHWHQGCEILFVHQGRGRVVVNRQTYEIRPGMLFFFQPFQLHKVHVDVDRIHPYERTVFHFDPVCIELQLSSFPSYRGLLSRMRQGISEQQAWDLSGELDYLGALCDSFNKCHNTLRNKNSYEEQAALFLLQFLSCIRVYSTELQKDSADSAATPMRYSEAIMQWLEEHYMEPFSLHRLGMELHLSKSYVSRIFHSETGSSITDYLMARRIKQACTLLKTSDYSVAGIGERVGMPNVSYFIRLFKKIVGTSPHQYRKSL